MMNVGSARIARLLPNRLIATNGLADTLYLTFDDGPHPELTMQVCKLLESYSIKASFFCVGNRIQTHPEIVEYLLNQSHLVANHSYNHSSFGKLSLDQQMDEINQCQQLIQSMAPQSPKIFRAPQGILSPSLLSRLLFNDWRIIHWSNDSMDYKQDSLEKRLDEFKGKGVSVGDILLFHDDNEMTIDMLKVLIPEWLEKGYKFATVKELI